MQEAENFCWRMNVAKLVSRWAEAAVDSQSSFFAFGQLSFPGLMVSSLALLSWLNVDPSEAVTFADTITT